MGCIGGSNFGCRMYSVLGSRNLCSQPCEHAKITAEDRVNAGSQSRNLGLMIARLWSSCDILRDFYRDKGDGRFKSPF